MSFHLLLSPIIFKVNFHLVASLNIMHISYLAAIKFFSLSLVFCSVTWIYPVWNSVNFLSLDWYWSTVENFQPLSPTIATATFSLFFPSHTPFIQLLDLNMCGSPLTNFSQPFFSVHQFSIFHLSVFLVTNPAVSNLLLNPSTEVHNFRYLLF